MGIVRDYLNPWGALRDARDELINHQQTISANDQLLNRKHVELTEARRTIETQATRIRMQKEEIMRLNDQLQTTTKRDPKTGRYLPKPKPDKGP